MLLRALVIQDGAILDIFEREVPTARHLVRQTKRDLVRTRPGEGSVHIELHDAHTKTTLYQRAWTIPNHYRG